MATILQELNLVGIIPVIAIDKAEHAEPLAAALSEGGLPCAEVTFRTSAAREAIGKISAKFPNMLLGAGTVLTVEQVKAAWDAGAKYIVSPGINRRVVEFCLSEGIPVTPGVSTPSDVELAMELGLEVVKFFPAEAAGGLPFLKALAGPYGKVRYIPTGGIDESNLLAYLKFPKTFACGGSWMVKSDLISSGQFEKIREITARALALMLGFSLDRVTFPAAERRDSATLERVKLLGAAVDVKSGASSKDLPVVDVVSNFPDRAYSYLTRQGLTVENPEKDREGNLATFSLGTTNLGFRVRVIRKA